VVVFSDPMSKDFDDDNLRYMLLTKFSWFLLSLFFFFFFYYFFGKMLVHACSVRVTNVRSPVEGGD
jgi:hypothetical protein